MRVLHFSDAHIDMANFGRHDPLTGLPLRVLDFLKSLDEIINTAINEKVDLVVFSGDAYKDRSPAPTFQREWGKRIIRLSKAGIRTLLLVGNHDVSPALGRANAIQEFETLDIPFVTVLASPCFIPSESVGLPVQVLALPWISRSGLLADGNTNVSEVFTGMEQRITELIQNWLDQVDPNLPTILVAHASIQGAVFGSERTVMLGADLVLPGSLVRDPRLDYVALGHIHKAQDLNEGAHPPVIYPGSIERVDFGEAGDDKYFVIADIQKGKTRVDWRKLSGIRTFIDRFIELQSSENITDTLINCLPSRDTLKEAIVRLTVKYPREWDTLIDEAALRRYTEGAFEFHLIKRPQMDARIRLSPDQVVANLGPLELLEQYWLAVKVNENERTQLRNLAKRIISGETNMDAP